MAEFTASTAFKHEIKGDPLPDRGFIDIDGDEVVDIKIDLYWAPGVPNNNGHPYPKRAPRLSVNGGDWLSTNSPQYTQYTYKSYDTDPNFSLEDWSSYDESLFDDYDKYAAASTTDWHTGYITLPNNDDGNSVSQENYILYFANQDKSVVTRFVGDHGYGDTHDAAWVGLIDGASATPDQATYNSWTMLSATASGGDGSSSGGDGSSSGGDSSSSGGDSSSSGGDGSSSGGDSSSSGGDSSSSGGDSSSSQSESSDPAGSLQIEYEVRKAKRVDGSSSEIHDGTKNNPASDIAIEDIDSESASGGSRWTRAARGSNNLPPVKSLAVRGIGAKEDSNVILDIKAKNLSDYDLESVDLTIKFDSHLFGDIKENQVIFNENIMPLANAVHIDNANGEIRIAAGSLSYFGAEEGTTSGALGSGLKSKNATEGDKEGILASIAFNFSDDLEKDGGVYTRTGDGNLLTYSGANGTTNKFDGQLDFDIEVNKDHTIFSKVDSALGTEAIASLRDMDDSRVDLVKNKVSLYEGTIDLHQTSFLKFGSERKIGVGASPITTNLIRAGDTISAEVDWKNKGNTTASDFRVENWDGLGYDAETRTWAAGSLKGSNWIAAVDVNKSGLVDSSDKDSDPTTELLKGATDATLTGGDFSQDGTYSDKNEQTNKVRITVDINDNAAGKVFNASDDLYQIKVDGEATAFRSHDGQQAYASKNLITFKGDLNYDGNVGMKDLAFLNAGARRQTIESGQKVASEATYARDVDANFDGKISIDDLTVLDEDWGKTLHLGDENFQGKVGSDGVTTQITWTELDSQTSADVINGVSISTADRANSWINTSFKNQNALEKLASTDGYDSPLGERLEEDQTLADTNIDQDVVSHGGEGLTTGLDSGDSSNDMRWTSLQDDIIGGSST
ncbi:hypothetical protein [Prochlorococcus marinus]|uniref:hypothetical protein n=1 Tax=Prochlorococcus marinus TaxID=1219 RepID=UPI0007BBBA1E|nr:hypothetical protein [Prochlorococcus marinus]KZR77563.1 hypothetical protein PMIT1323_00940 [Prochlorococcus marinus str. MIT 1323]